MEIVVINTPTINLDQFLKWIGIIDTGGQTRLMLEDQLIRINGVLTIERRKKLRPDDIVEVSGVGAWKLIYEPDE